MACLSGRNCAQLYDQCHSEGRCQRGCVEVVIHVGVGLDDEPTLVRLIVPRAKITAC